MKNRWIWFGLCIILGAVMIVLGWLVPQHLRAVDDSVLQRAGRNGQALIDRGLALVKDQKLGAAQMLQQAAQDEGLRGQEKLIEAIQSLAKQHPELVAWGSPEPRLADLDPAPLVITPETNKTASAKPELTSAHYQVSAPITEVLIKLKNRERVLDQLAASRQPAVQELLRCRELTNTAIFPSSQTASGQAIDAAIALTGLLVDGEQLSPSLRGNLSTLASEANHGGKTQPLEEALLNIMSLGQRLNWGQVVEFASQIDDSETLRVMAVLVRKDETRLPTLFAVTELSGKPAEIVQYLKTYSQTGFRDLSASLRFGSGGVNELLHRHMLLSSSSLRQQIAHREPLNTFYDFGVDTAWLNPRFAMIMKWALYLLGGFLLALALHFARPAVTDLEKPLQVGGFHVAREILFALGFLLVVLVLSEPFLAQESQKEEYHFRLRLPTVGSVVPVGNNSVKPTIMNNKSLLTLLLFFVLQALLYTACVFKLAEIRRQRIPTRIKLKLLENEEHLFDAGLYLGFAGTIISLILVSMSFIQPSLMAAYGSTSFGIIFVSIFKIFHLRPARRKLLLEAESTSIAAAQAASQATAPRPTFAAPL